MEQDQGYGPFRWPDIDHTHVLGQKVGDYESSLFAPVDLDLSSIKLENPYAPTEDLEKDLRLPDLESFHFGPLEDLESLADSDISEPGNGTPIDQEDIWKVAFDLGPANKGIKFYTWDAFRDPKHEEPRSAYVSEAGPSVFDALEVDRSPVASLLAKPLHVNILLGTLYQVGLGRASVLFRFNEATGTFESSIQGARVSGCTSQLSHSLTEYFISCGTLFRRLVKFSDKTIAQGSQLSTRVALAHAIGSILLATEEHLSNALSSLQSLLQLQRLFARPKVLFQLMQEMIQCIEDSKSNEELLSNLFQKAEHLAESGSWLSDCAFSIFRQVCNPWLRDVENWIGLRQDMPVEDSEYQKLPGFVSLCDVEQREAGERTQSAHEFDEEKRPDFLAAEEAQAIFETGKAFRVLRNQHPEHPLCTPQRHNISSQLFEWTSNFDDVQRVVEKANAYEVELKAAIRRFHSGELPSAVIGSPKFDPEHDEDHAWADSDAQSQWLYGSMTVFDAPPRKHFQNVPDTLQEIVHNILTTESQDSGTPERVAQPIPLALVPSLSLDPLLYTQAHLVHTTMLRLLFHSHQLRSHLFVLNAYQLLGHGTFLFRLTNALFSSDLASAERRKGMPRIGQTMGLQLGSRATWPPASSELRLVLMGILSESYHSLGIDHRNASFKSYEIKDRDLPGGLSFSVRQLSEDEIEKCTQPDSLHALDFLRLQYTPPQPLDIIVTPISLQSYDAIFKFLLRVVRMQWVADQQCNSFSSGVGRRTKSRPHQAHDDLAARFRFEANHFVSTVTSHFFSTGVSAIWHRFDTYISDLERCLGDPGYLDRNKTSGDSITAVRNAHETMLEQIMTALFLKKRQARVMRALEEIFDAILKFVGLQRTEQDGLDHDQVQKLYMKFRNNVRGFLDAWRRASEKEGEKSKEPGISSGLDEQSDAIEVKLSMNAYYDNSY